MITAVFTDNSDYARATGLWQWDYGQRLRIEGLHLPTAVEIHFALAEFAGDAITRVGTTKDGVTEVVIPDSLLENQAAGATYEIYAWIYLADKTSGETIKRISMQVKRRAKPEGHDTPEDAELFREAIEAVNASADRAETAREAAEAAQKAAEAAAGKIEGEIAGAGQIAEQVKQDAAAVADDRSAVSQLVTETTQNAQKAAEAAQAAENSSTAAKQAQEVSERAGERATSAMEATEKDRTEVAENRKAVEQAKKAVAADRRAVENTALQFGQAAQSAINAVGQAQEAAVGAVSAEGQRQTTAVQQAGTQAVSGVAEAKTTAVQAVTTEGDTQTKRVQDAAAGIVADREQIAANKTGIEALSQKKADAIVETAQGETMTLADSSDKLFEGLRVFGKSTQDGTPSVENPVPIVNAGENGSIKVEVTGRNLISKTGYRPFIDISIPADVKIFASVEDTADEFVVNVVNVDGTVNMIPMEKEKDNRRYGFRTLSAESKQMRFHGTIATPMLAISKEYIPYEPYCTIQSLTLATPNGLPGVPVSKDGNYTDENGQQYICDEVDLGREKYVQRVKDFIFNDKTNFSIDTYAKHENSILVNIKIEDASNRSTLSGNPLLCDKLKACREDIFVTDEVSCGYTSGANFLRVRLPISAGTTNEGVKNYLTDKSFKILYILATPIERDLTPEELAAYSSLHTNCPTTVITNDAGAHMEASYVADTGTYIRNMEERLNAKLVNIQSALISQKISGGGIKVTDSSRVPVVRFAMWGKTEQRKTSGAQLFDVTNVDMKTILNVDGTTNANGSIHTSGFIKVSPNTTYSVSKTRQNRGKFYNLEKKPLTTDKFDFELSNNGDKFTTSESVEYVRFSIYETVDLNTLMMNQGDTLKPYEPYSGGFPSPSPDYSQPIEITDQPVTVTIKGGTEQQSITLMPPKPMTKWDKLEKVDGVWCWVYQSKHILSYSAESITGEYFSTTGELSTGAEVYYKADVPENIPLSPSEQAQLNALMMYAGTTEVTNTGGCNMELTYTVDTKSYVDSKIAAISAAVLEV